MPNTHTNSDANTNFYTQQFPVAINDFYGVDQLAALNEPVPGVLVNDSDPNTGDTLTAALVTGPSHASSFHFNSDGSFTYAPVGNYYGPDTFTYQAYDGRLYSNIATVTVTVRQPCSLGGFVTGGGKFFQNSRKCTFGFVAKMRNNVPQGNLEFQDHDMNIDLENGTVTWVYVPNMIDGSFSGACSVNHITGYSYFVQLHDRGEPGTTDDFSVWIYDVHGTQIYTSGSMLSGGNIQIHDTASGSGTSREWWCDNDQDGYYGDYGFSCTAPFPNCRDTNPGFISTATITSQK